MRMKMKYALVTSLALVMAGWASAGPEYEEVFDQSYSLGGDGRVSLENINGDVSIEVWERDEVRVHAVKSASSPELLEKLEVDVQAGGDSVRIETHYPSMKSSDGHHEHRSFTKVEYTLTVPRGAMLRTIDLVNGSLKVVGVEGGIEAETVNGDIVVHIERLGYGDEIEMDSVNGPLDLYLSRSISADIAAESVHGSLGNDFGIDVRKGKYVGSDFHGSVGGGGAQVSLETVNGSIKVHSL
jgi:DUF4097 and DUF4098 domain-containing protein YvlB